MNDDTRPAAAGAVASKLTTEFLERVVYVATAMEGEDQANGIVFALACYELAGKEAPDFGRLSGRDNGPDAIDTSDVRG